MPAAKNGKLKQKHLEGMEPPSSPKLDALAEEYVEARNSRMEMLKVEVDRRDLLHAAMVEAGLTRYENEACVVEVATTEKVKVKKRDGAEGDELDD